MNSDHDDWNDAEPTRADGDAGGGFVLQLDGYEGPIDVLLELARSQKVDLAEISILQLVDQFLAFVREAKRFGIIACCRLPSDGRLACLPQKPLAGAKANRRR